MFTIKKKQQSMLKVQQVMNLAGHVINHVMPKKAS